MNVIFQDLQGGLGNKLLMVLNLIALSKQYNKIIRIKNNGKIYKIFSRLVEEDISSLRAEKYSERSFSYQKINLSSGKNYIMIGYFQSFKYFWDATEDIKKHLVIDNCHSRPVGKKTIALHIRLGNYLQKSDYHFNLPYSYYYSIIDDIYNEKDYQLVLFSDDIKMAAGIFKKYQFTVADDYAVDEEDQLFIMSQCDIIIGSNSTYSLCASYLNEIYGFNPDSIYYFPNIWFAHKGPSFKKEDLFPKDKKYIIRSIHYTIVVLIHHDLKEWIDASEYLSMLKNQTLVDFQVMEINSDNADIFLTPSFFPNGLTLHKTFTSKTEALTYGLRFLMERCDYIITIELGYPYDLQDFANHMTNLSKDNTLLLEGSQDHFSNLALERTGWNTRLMRRLGADSCVSIKEWVGMMDSRAIRLLSPNDRYRSKIVWVDRSILGCLIKEDGPIPATPGVKIYPYSQDDLVNQVRRAYLECDDFIFFHNILFFITFYKIPGKHLFYEQLDLLEMVLEMLYLYKLIIITNRETLEFIEDYKYRFPTIEFWVREYSDYGLSIDTIQGEKRWDSVDFDAIIESGTHCSILSLPNIDSFDYCWYIDIISLQKIRCPLKRIFRYLRHENLLMGNNYDSYVLPVDKMSRFVDAYRAGLQQNVPSKDILTIISETWHECEKFDPW